MIVITTRTTTTAAAAAAFIFVLCLLLTLAIIILYSTICLATSVFPFPFISVVFMLQLCMDLEFCDSVFLLQWLSVPFSFEYLWLGLVIIIIWFKFMNLISKYLHNSKMKSMINKETEQKRVGKAKTKTKKKMYHEIGSTMCKSFLLLKASKCNRIVITPSI